MQRCLSFHFFLRSLLKTRKSACPSMTKYLGASTTNTKSITDTKCTTATATDNISRTEQGLIELAKSLADQVNLIRLPPPEPTDPGYSIYYFCFISEQQGDCLTHMHCALLAISNSICKNTNYIRSHVQSVGTCSNTRAHLGDTLQSASPSKHVQKPQSPF